MRCKEFKYKNYNHCKFHVVNYLETPKSMAIQIVGENGENISTCTVNMSDYLYYPDTATIKNYSENSGMTEFLSKLGIIEEIYSQVQCNPLAPKGETIDYCLINIDELKKYSSKFNYVYYLK